LDIEYSNSNTGGYERTLNTWHGQNMPHFIHGSDVLRIWPG